MSDTSAPAADPQTRIRRLLVALDASADCLDALDNLVALASGLQAELLGLVVEDTDLRDLAGHRIVTEFSAKSSGAALDPTMIDRTIRRHVHRVRHAVERAAAERQVQLNVEVRRGRTALEVVRCAGDEDVIVISRRARGFTVGWETADSRHAGSAAREIIRDAGRPVFLLGHAASLRGPVYAVFDGSDASRLALDLAVALADQSDERPLVVLVPAMDEARAATLTDAAHAQAASSESPVTVERLKGASLDALCPVITRRAGVLVVGGNRQMLQEMGSEHLLARTGCSLLLVPAPGETA